MGKWIVASTKTVYKAKLFQVKRLRIKFGNKEFVHDIAERHPTVSVFPITDNFELYLVSQYRYMLRKQTIEAMAGFIDRGESVLEAAKRELKEETGIVAKDWQELTKIEMAASVFKANSTIFVARNLEQGEAQNEDSEDIDIIKMSLDEAVKRVISGQINHSASIIGILMLDKMRRENKL